VGLKGDGGRVSLGGGVAAAEGGQERFIFWACLFYWYEGQKKRGFGGRVTLEARFGEKHGHSPGLKKGGPKPCPPPGRKVPKN